MNKKLLFVSAIIVGAFVWLGLTGCSRMPNKERHLRRAQSLFKAGDYDRAEIECLNVLRFDQTNLTALRMLAVMAHEQGRLLRAYALLTQLKEAAPEDLDVRVRFGRCALDGGQANQARQEALFVLGREPANGRALVLFAESSQTTNDLVEAQRFLENIAPTAKDIAEYQVAVGVVRVRLGDLDGAEKHFKRGIEINPKSSIAHLALGNLLVLKNDRGGAELELKTAAELSPIRSTARLRYADFKFANNDVATGRRLLEEITKRAPDYLPALHRLASLALADGRFSDCEGILKTILLRDASNLEALLMLAQLRVAQGAPAKAVAELERAVGMYPRIAQLHYRLAVAKLQINDLPGAIDSLKEALAIQPEYPEATLLLAQINVRQGNTDVAIRALSDVLERNPRLVQAHMLLADAYRARGELGEAYNVFAKLSRLYPTNPEPALLKGLVLRQQGKNADARVCFEQSLALAPDYILPLEQLVRLDIAEKRYDAARERLLQQWARFPTNAVYPYLLGLVYFAQTNLVDAESVLKKALEIAPELTAANSLLAQVYVAANKQREALDKLEQLIAQNTNDVFSLMQLAQLHSANSNYAAAAAAYEKILTVNPRFAPAQNNLAWLYAERLGRLDRAYDLARRAYDSDPRNPYYADTLGWVLCMRAEYPQAVVLLSESAQALPEEPEVLFHLGMAHYMLGEETAAKATLQKAVLLGQTAPWLSDARNRLAVLDESGSGADRITELERRASGDPKDPIVLLRLARAYQEAGEVEKAVATYEKALKIQPNLASALVKLAELYAWNLNDTTQALELARKARALSPNNPVIAHVLGRLAFRVRDYKWAYSLLQESASALTNDMQARFDFAMAAYSLGQVSNAIAAVQPILAAEAQNPLAEKTKTFVELAGIQLDPERAVDATGKVERILQKDPDYVPALMVLGVIREKQGNYADARDAYERVLKQMPSFTPANRALAFIYHDRFNDVAKAYEHALKAREAFPQDPHVARLLGVISYKRGDYQHAAQLLSECAARFPKDADLLFYLGSAQYKLKQQAQSKESLTKALELASDPTWAAEARRILSELN